MAVTKTHPIKSTLKAAIDYILNPEKTDGKLLASSFGCGLETADIEFAWTREAAGDRGTHLGRHLIQSFAVGETTPEEAHKIGMELAGAVLGGKYEFVLTTHVDKDHLHNHLIFNAVSFVDYKKYHSNKQSYHFIRRTSDRICKEHGLSVVVPGQDKGKTSPVSYPTRRTEESWPWISGWPTPPCPMTRRAKSIPVSKMCFRCGVIQRKLRAPSLYSAICPLPKTTVLSMPMMI